MSIVRQPYELVERNLRHAMAFYAGAHRSGQIQELPGLAAICCGWNYPVFNSVLLTSSVPGTGGELSVRIAAALKYFASLKMGWSYWACHDMLDAATLRQLRETCQRFGLEPVVTAPGMCTRSLAPPVRAAHPIEIREVVDSASRLEFAHLVSLIFELPFQMTMHMYGREESWRPGYAGFIGYVDKQPVSIVMVCIAEECCGFYSVGTVPAYRRRGYAESVMREAYRQVQTRLKCSDCVLQSSTAGRRLYEQMGFREVTRFSVFRSVSG